MEAANRGACAVHNRWIVPLFVLAITVIGPLLGREYGRYLLGLYVLLLPWMLMSHLPRPHLAPFIYVYLAANAFAFVLHFGDLDSMLNAGSLVLAITTTAVAAYHSVRGCGAKTADHALEKWLWIALVVSFFISSLLTAVNWPTAPDYYFWEVFYSDKRLLLLNADAVGHSASLWIIALLAAFAAHRVFAEKREKAVWLILLVILIIFLLSTKSRLALFYVVNLFVMVLAYKRVPFFRPMVLFVPAVFSIGIIFASISPGIGSEINLLARAVQQEVGNWLRVTPGEDSRFSVFSGRDVLNEALISASIENPVRGLGDKADILTYGVDDDGSIAYEADRALASTESVLRLAVKYGWPYFIALAAFLWSVPFLVRRLPRQEQILKVGLWGICIQSIAIQGGMEVFYGISGLFLFLLALLTFQGAGVGSGRALVVRPPEIDGITGRNRFNARPHSIWARDDG
jgi:hypothetical protein